MSEDRYERLEYTIQQLAVKVDKMADVLAELARIEERHIAVQQRLDNHADRLNKHGEALDTHAVEIASVKNRSQFNEWFIRGLIAAMVGTIAFILRG